jgi:hypothetical protein
MDDDNGTSLVPGLTRTVSDVSSAYICTLPNLLSRAGSRASASTAATRGADGALSAEKRVCWFDVLSWRCGSL